MMHGKQHLSAESAMAYHGEPTGKPLLNRCSAVSLPSRGQPAKSQRFDAALEP